MILPQCTVESCEIDHATKGFWGLHYKIRVDNRYKRKYPPKPNHTLVHNIHPLYHTYDGMKLRCYNVKHDNYKHYGARGIVVCERWLGSIEWCGFCAFVEDMGERPEGMTLDRIDNDGDYSPENCKWSDIFTQNRNTRQQASSSGIRGVNKDGRKNNWYANIGVDGKKLYLGSFRTKEEAAECRRNAETKYWAVK